MSEYSTVLPLPFTSALCPATSRVGKSVEMRSKTSTRYFDSKLFCMCTGGWEDTPVPRVQETVTREDSTFVQVTEPINQKKSGCCEQQLPFTASGMRSYRTCRISIKLFSSDGSSSSHA